MKNREILPTSDFRRFQGNAPGLADVGRAWSRRAIDPMMALSVHRERSQSEKSRMSSFFLCSATEIKN